MGELALLIMSVASLCCCPTPPPRFTTCATWARCPGWYFAQEKVNGGPMDCRIFRTMQTFWQPAAGTLGTVPSYRGQELTNPATFTVQQKYILPHGGYQEIDVTGIPAVVKLLVGASSASGRIISASWFDSGTSVRASYDIRIDEFGQNGLLIVTLSDQVIDDDVQSSLAVLQEFTNWGAITAGGPGFYRCWTENGLTEEGGFIAPPVGRSLPNWIYQSTDDWFTMRNPTGYYPVGHEVVRDYLQWYNYPTFLPFNGNKYISNDIGFPSDDPNSLVVAPAGYAKVGGSMSYSKVDFPDTYNVEGFGPLPTGNCHELLDNSTGNQSAGFASRPPFSGVITDPAPGFTWENFT